MLVKVFSIDGVFRGSFQGSFVNPIIGAVWRYGPTYKNVMKDLEVLMLFCTLKLSYILSSLYGLMVTNKKNW